MSTYGWVEPFEGLTDICEQFQRDLSQMVDGEIDESAAGRALVHLETCDGCREFLEDTRECVQMHRDICDPDRLMARLSILIGSDAGLVLENIELVHRLATIFYRLGKSYVLLETSSQFRQRVFEEAVPVESTRLHGRGFVDGVVMSGRDRTTGLDWTTARGMLNGRLESIQEPLEKGRRLLQEAIAADPSHEEARLYLAYVRTLMGQPLRAAGEYRQIFRSAVHDANRGHAAMQLGLLHELEGDRRAALRCFRWVTISGLADRDPRFFPARFNIGLNYTHLGQRDKALAAFRRLIDAHREHLDAISELFAHSPNLQASIESQPGFLPALVLACPELFGAASAPTTTDPDGSGES